jgi:hypothetical protein
MAQSSETGTPRKKEQREDALAQKKTCTCSQVRTRDHVKVSISHYLLPGVTVLGVQCICSDMSGPGHDRGHGGYNHWDRIWDMGNGPPRWGLNPRGHEQGIGPCHLKEGPSHQATLVIEGMEVVNCKHWAKGEERTQRRTKKK